MRLVHLKIKAYKLAGYDSVDGCPHYQAFLDSYYAEKEAAIGQQQIQIYDSIGVGIFYSTPFGIGFLIYQGLRLTRNLNFRTYGWIFLLMGIVALAGYSFIVAILTSLLNSGL